MTSSQSRNSALHSLLVSGMALGIVIFVVAVYFMVTGEYTNLAARQASETLLNKIAIGGLLFSAIAWYADQFARPILTKIGIKA